LNLAPSLCNNYLRLVYFYAHTKISFYFKQKQAPTFGEPYHKTT
jgi:hypothetical protein